jgi:hypothetical protein
MRSGISGTDVWLDGSPELRLEVGDPRWVLHFNRTNQFLDAVTKVHVPPLLRNPNKIPSVFRA